MQVSLDLDEVDLRLFACPRQGDTVFNIEQVHEAHAEESEAEARRAEDQQALLEDMKTDVLPMYDANELQAQFQEVAAVQQSLATTTATVARPAKGVDFFYEKGGMTWTQ